MLKQNLRWQITDTKQMKITLGDVDDVECITEEAMETHRSTRLSVEPLISKQSLPVDNYPRLGREYDEDYLFG